MNTISPAFGAMVIASFQERPKKILERLNLSGTHPPETTVFTHGDTFVFSSPDTNRVTDISNQLNSLGKILIKTFTPIVTLTTESLEAAERAAYRKNAPGLLAVLPFEPKINLPRQASLDLIGMLKEKKPVAELRAFVAKNFQAPNGNTLTTTQIQDTIEMFKDWLGLAEAKATAAA